MSGLGRLARRQWKRTHPLQWPVRFVEGSKTWEVELPGKEFVYIRSRTLAEKVSLIPAMQTVRTPEPLSEAFAWFKERHPEEPDTTYLNVPGASYLMPEELIDAIIASHNAESRLAEAEGLDRGKTNEINILTRENRDLQQQLEAAREQVTRMTPVVAAVMSMCSKCSEGIAHPDYDCALPDAVADACREYAALSASEKQDEAGGVR